MSNAIRAALAALVLATAFIGAEASAVPVVVPNSLAATEGNDSNFGPFFDFSTRYQQVYSASQFPSGPLNITQIAFRPDGSVNDPNLFIRFDSVRIDLSTTTAAPGALSTVFANNVGADNKTVFNSFAFLTAPVTGPAGGPKDFTVTFNVTPFSYDPSAGNLLLDVRAFSSSGGISAPFDAQAGSPFTTHVDASGISSSSGEAFATGLVTQFQVLQAVPEPSTLTLASLATLMVLGTLGHRRLTRG